jgi:hypothetical protein
MARGKDAGAAEVVRASDAPAPGPDPMLAGHLVIYPQGVLAFRADGSEAVTRQQIPPMFLPLLVKMLKGEQLGPADMPGGLAGRMAGAMMNRG